MGSEMAPKTSTKRKRSRPTSMRRTTRLSPRRCRRGGRKGRRTQRRQSRRQYNPDAPAPAASAGRPQLGQKKLKELNKAGHPAERLQASFDKCWADARAHAAGRDNKYDAWWKEMLANQGIRIALLKATSAAKKRNTDLAFLIGDNDASMDEEMRAWYNAHRQDIFRPSSTASSSPLTTSTPATEDASPPEA
jgi:hypothetical protein